MIRIAWRELRHHPGRYLATLLAIAISVGFMAAVSVVMATESKAMVQQVGAPYVKVDLTVDVEPAMPSTDETTAQQITDKIGQVPGVDTAWYLANETDLLTNQAATAMVTLYANPPAAFSWDTVGQSRVATGDWQLADGGVLISASVAKALGVQVGAKVGLGSSPEPLTVSGITNQPSSVFATDSAYVSPSTYAQLTGGTGVVPYGLYLVGLQPGVDLGQVSDAIRAQLNTPDLAVSITTGAERASSTASELTGGIDTFKYLLWVFAGVALVVGMITIANTFAILLAQRRRQLGLLRAVGAEGSQVRHSVWAEAGVLGLVGSLVGIGVAYALASVVGALTGSIHWGLALPWAELAVCVAIGVVVTTLASALPAQRASRQPVLDALRPVEASVTTSRVSLPRAVVCSLLAVGGIAACLYSLTGSGTHAILLAVGGAGLTSLGVLFAAPLFMPALLAGLGKLIGRAGVVGGAAAKNVVRDPGRSSATATAIMLAVGLVVTLQVGAASIQKTMLDKIDSAYPIGLWVAADSSGIDSGTLDRLRTANGVTAMVTLKCGWGVIASPQQPMFYGLVCAYDSAIRSVSASPVDDALADDEVLVPPSGSVVKAGTVSLQRADDSTKDLASLQAVASNLVRDAPFVLVSPATLAKLGGSATVGVALMSVGDAVTAMRSVNDILGTDSPLSFGGSAPNKQVISLILSVLVAILTALLAVAVLIALVGVGNTLTLSVVERTRESALLRALGLQRGQLRLMLLMEALLITLAATLVGAVFGVFFGYVGAHSVVGQAMSDSDGRLSLTLRLAVDWPQMLGLLAVLVVAAGLASVLPGRRAASAAPVEAMAEV